MIRGLIIVVQGIGFRGLGFKSLGFSEVLKDAYL